MISDLIVVFMHFCFNNSYQLVMVCILQLAQDTLTSIKTVNACLSCVMYGEEGKYKRSEDILK